METLEQFIQSNPNPRELKRALAVHMSQQNDTYREIRDVLQVSIGFVSACCQRYQEQGIEGLKLNYWGTQVTMSGKSGQ
ncbi:helix-turn-helix domain-containing protein [Candidatus Synechococcus calcipolaris]|nr:helix-turn-helix domain-containing protein [Candidatus Synechococcus calcipolaris]